MKKILGISLVALMSVTAANAEIASKGYVDQGIQSLDATVSKAAGADGLALEVVETDGKLTSVSGSIAANTYDAHGAAAAVADYVGTIPQGAIEAGQDTIVKYIDAKASGDAGAAVAALDANVSQTAGADGLALSVTQADGVITAVSGSIAANTYDAYGTASTAEQNAKAHADELNTAMDARMDAAEGDIDILNGNASTEGSVAYAVAAEAALRTAADNAINDTIGTVPQGSNVMAEVEAAKSANTTAIAALDSEGTAEAKKVITGVTMTDGKITSVTSADPLTNAAYQLQQAGGEAGKYVLTAVYTGETLTGYAWELIDRNYND